MSRNKQPVAETLVAPPTFSLSRLSLDSFGACLYWTDLPDLVRLYMTGNSWIQAQLCRPGCVQDVVWSVSPPFGQPLPSLLKAMPSIRSFSLFQQNTSEYATISDFKLEILPKTLLHLRVDFSNAFVNMLAASPAILSLKSYFPNLLTLMLEPITAWPFNEATTVRFVKNLPGSLERFSMRLSSNMTHHLISLLPPSITALAISIPVVEVELIKWPPLLKCLHLAAPLEVNNLKGVTLPHMLEELRFDTTIRLGDWDFAQLPNLKTLGVFHAIGHVPPTLPPLTDLAWQTDARIEPQDFRNVPRTVTKLHLFNALELLGAVAPDRNMWTGDRLLPLLPPSLTDLATNIRLVTDMQSDDASLPAFPDTSWLKPYSGFELLSLLPPCSADVMLRWNVGISDADVAFLPSAARFTGVNFNFTNAKVDMTQIIRHFTALKALTLEIKVANFSFDLDCLPSTLESLIITGEYFSTQLVLPNHWPARLEYLRLQFRGLDLSNLRLWTAALPSSLLTLNASVGKSRVSSLHTLPPRLQCLIVQQEATDARTVDWDSCLTDDDIAKLPRSLTHLSTRGYESKLTMAGIKHLPRKLRVWSCVGRGFGQRKTRAEPSVEAILDALPPMVEVVHPPHNFAKLWDQDVVRRITQRHSLKTDLALANAAAATAMAES